MELENEVLSRYSIALAVVVNENSVSYVMLPLECRTQKRDLSMQDPLNKDKSYCEARTRKCVYKYDSHIIGDIVSTDMQTIDSLEKYLLVMKQIGRYKYARI